MNHVRLCAIILLASLSIAVQAQKLKSKTIFFSYKAPSEISFGDGLETYTVKVVGTLNQNKQLVKDFNSRSLSIPGLKVTTAAEAAIELQLRSNNFVVINDDIKSKGKDAEKKYYVKKEVLIQNVSIAATQMLPKKRFLYSRDYFKDTVIFKRRDYSSPDAIKFNSKDIENQYNAFLFNTYSSYFNMFRKHFTNYLQTNLFYIKEKQAIYEEYEDLVKMINKEVLTSTIDEQLADDQKKVIKDFIAKTAALLTHITNEKLSDLEEFSSGLHVNLALGYLMTNEFGKYYEHYQAISEEHHKGDKEDLFGFGKQYQNYVIRGLNKYEAAAIFEGEWQIVDIRAAYPLDINKDGKSHFSLVGKELPACIGNETINFSRGGEMSYTSVSKIDCSTRENKMCWRYYVNPNKIGQYLGWGEPYNGKCEIEDKSDLIFISSHELVLSRQVYLLPGSDTTEDAFLILRRKD